MAQQIKVLASKPEDLSLIPGSESCGRKRELIPQNFPLTSTRMQQQCIPPTYAHVSTHRSTHVTKIKRE